MEEVKILREALENFLCPDVKTLFQKSISDTFFENICEIRMRIAKPIIIKNLNREWTITNNFTLTDKINSGYIVTPKNLSDTFEIITNYSPYAFENQIKNGFITISGGHRIGFCGEAIIENDKIKSIRNINSLNFRIAHQIKNCARPIIKFLCQPHLMNTMIISPPGCGKTTLLRDIIRILSDKYTISLVDERSEISGSYMGIAQNDLGIHTDILDNCPKTQGMLMMLRTMSPQIIAVDEIGTVAEANAILNIIACGVKIFCTAHGKDLDDIKNRDAIKILMAKKIIERYVILEAVGKIKNIYDKDLQVVNAK